MESKDIIKAFECCTKNNCEDCPYKLDWDCESFILENALNLIKNQQAEIERLEELVNEMSDYFPACIDCDGKDNFGARTDKCVYLIDKTNFCAKQGIKNIASIQKENRSLKCELKTAKTEAYKEFAEKLKEKAEVVKNPFDYTENLAVYVEDIDKTFKELTERKGN